MNESDETEKGAPSGRRLFYVTDPMCSWCWGFRAAAQVIRESLATDVAWVTVLGGLAPDSEEEMDAPTRRYVQSAWRAVAERTGARFEHAFWDEHTPKRQTYPACRAVLAAESLRAGAGEALFDAIQEAYYLEARDPSDPETLVTLAGELELDPARFARALTLETVQARLAEDLALRDTLGVRGFPSLVFEDAEGARLLTSGYLEPTVLLERLAAMGALRDNARPR